MSLGPFLCLPVDLQPRPAVLSVFHTQDNLVSREFPRPGKEYLSWRWKCHSKILLICNVSRTLGTCMACALQHLNPLRAHSSRNPSCSLAHLQMFPLTLRVSDSFSAVILNWEQFCPLGEIWQSLETCLRVITSWVGWWVGKLLTCQ